MPIFSGFPCLNDVSCFYEQYEKYSNCEGKEFELALKQCNDYILNPEDDMATSSLDSCSMATCVETLKPVDQSFESTICTEKKNEKKEEEECCKELSCMEKFNQKCDECSQWIEEYEAQNEEIADLKQALTKLKMEKSNPSLKQIKPKKQNEYEVERILTHAYRGKGIKKELCFEIKWKFMGF